MPRSTLACRAVGAREGPSSVRTVTLAIIAARRRRERSDGLQAAGRRVIAGKWFPVCVDATLVPLHSQCVIRESVVTVFFLAAAASLSSNLSCSRQSTESQQSSFEVIDVAPSAAADLIARGEVRVLDVRTPQEFELGHIDGAINQNIDGTGFDAALATLQHDKPYLVHCAAGTPGGRSRRATTALQSAGARQVYHLTGGFIAWAREGHPTTTD